jgi:hypothetical protein
MVKITLDRAPLWVQELEGKLKKAAEKGMISAAHRGVAEIQEIIDREPRVPVDRGTYRAGWRVRQIEKGALVYNNVPHAGLIEEGVKGGRVKIGRAMIDALAEWGLRKGLVEGKGPEQAANARRFAFAVARSMKKNGIFNKGKGLRILERARKLFPRFIEEEVRAEIDSIR